MPTARTICELRDGPATINYLEVSAPAARAVEFGGVRLRITWDDREHASVDAPLDLLFGAGTLHNPDGREWLVKALPMAIRFVGGRVVLSCQFPMPFFRAAKLELVGSDRVASIDDVRWVSAHAPYEGPWNHVGYFHATYRDHGEPTFGEDLVFLDTRNVEGAPDWSGSLVGTSFVFTDRNVLTTLEGDPRFYFDDSRTPQVQGTGTEEWGGGGDYWGGRTMTLPLAGHPVGVVDAKQAKSPLDLIHSAYRFLLADLMPFGQRAKVCFEHGGENESVEHYRSVTHWYGLPSASLVLTDSLDIGDPDERARPSLSVARRHRAVRRHVALRTRAGSSVGGDRAAADRAGSLRGLSIRRTGGRYHLWVELRAGAGLFDAAVWVQSNDDVGSGQAREECTGLGGFLNLGRATGYVSFSDRRRADVRHRVRAERYATIARSTADRPAGDRPHRAEPEPDHAAAGRFRTGAGRDRADSGRCVATTGAFEARDDERCRGRSRARSARASARGRDLPCRNAKGAQNARRIGVRRTDSSRQPRRDAATNARLSVG